MRHNSRPQDTSHTKTQRQTVVALLLFCNANLHVALSRLRKLWRSSLGLGFLSFAKTPSLDLVVELPLCITSLSKHDDMGATVNCGIVVHSFDDTQSLPNYAENSFNPLASSIRWEPPFLSLWHCGRATTLCRHHRPHVLTVSLASPHFKRTMLIHRLNFYELFLHKQ